MGKVAANTGEENENTIHSARVKLHVMDSSSGWKERGTGALRLNVEKESKKARMGEHLLPCLPETSGVTRR